MTSELTSSEYFELIGELIPELTSSQCNWKGNRKGKGTDETPQGLLSSKHQGKQADWQKIQEATSEKLSMFYTQSILMEIQWCNDVCIRGCLKKHQLA